MKQEQGLNEMTKWCVLLLVAVGVAGCNHSGRNGSVGGQAAPKPKPVAVRPFDFGRPDVVLLVTGATNGKLEVCNCSGPMPGGLARRGGLVASYRAAFPNTVLIDTGDVFWIEPHDLMNIFVMKGYRLMGYDAVTLGDQEWTADDKFLRKVLQPGRTKYLSTTVAAKDKSVALPITPVLRRAWGDVQLAVLSDIRPEAFMFFPRRRYKQLAFSQPGNVDARIAGLRKNRSAVVVVVHGSQSDLEAAAGRLDADLILWGHTQKSDGKLLSVAGKPVVRVGGSDYIGVVGMKISPVGKITAMEYRLEIIDDRWPLDKRMLELYQAYARQAMRKALDAKRKKGLEIALASTCGSCHPKRYASWKKSKHANAWKSLQKVRRTGDPNCVTCHSLGFGMEKGFYTYKKTPKLAGVHCQSCHRFSVAEHQKKGFFASGKNRVGPKACMTCHTPVTDPKFSEQTQRRFDAIGRGATLRALKAKGDKGL
ncbi:MAG: hypothetical protein K8S55_08985 [Phycisphaerae bacterium]|nr:hypothetical protein [Phycisphaerae bacterium]